MDSLETPILPIPEGRPKSGRKWKVKKVARSSAQFRCGVLSHLSKSYEERKSIAQKLKNVKEFESELIESRKQRKRDIRIRREELRNRRMENEYKNSEYQVVS
jgi:hypothetical protein